MPVVLVDEGVVGAGLGEGEAEEAESRVRLEEGQEVLGAHVVLARQVERHHPGKHGGVAQQELLRAGGEGTALSFPRNKYSTWIFICSVNNLF